MLALALVELDAQPAAEIKSVASESDKS